MDDIINRYPHTVKDSTQVDDAVDAYIKVLTAQEDNSVTIAAIGFPMNIRDVLKKDAALFNKKVKAVYWMNGMYNFGCAEAHWIGSTVDCYGAAQWVQENWDHKVKEYFQLNGGDMGTGGTLKDCQDSSSPVRQAYVDWLGRTGGSSRPSWDPVTVYVAVVGTEEAQMWEEKGTDEINALGQETWDKSWTTNNEVSLWYTNNNKKAGVVDILNKMMCANPANKPTPPKSDWTKFKGANCYGARGSAPAHGANDMENPVTSSCGDFNTIEEC